MSHETFIVETKGKVGIVRLNRPQALNALNAKVNAELTAALDAFEADDKIACVIITGNEKAFAAGADIKEMAGKSHMDAYMGDFAANWDRIARMRKPAIAAVAGFALGGGCELAMMCDFIIAADNAKSGQPEIKLGVIPGIGGTQRPTRAAWQAKAKRYGFTVKDVPVPNPHPGFDHYVDAFRKMITPQTKVISFTHLTSTVGDLFPAKELCKLARERGILTLVDGAQSFGLMDVDLSDMQPDFYSGSAHKWPCGPKENGVLYINKASQSKIWASIFSAYPGRVGVSKTFEGFGQRDEPAMIAFGEALSFQTKIGRALIEKRSRELTQALIAGLKKVDGVKIWTSPDPSRTVAVLSFQPGDLDVRKLSLALYQKDRIGCATRGGQDRPGIRLSPHFYNTMADVDRTVGAIKKYMATGV